MSEFVDSSSHSSLRKRRGDREQPDENNASAGIEEIRSRSVQTILSKKELNPGAPESQTGQEDGARSSDKTREATPDLKESEETKAECPNKSKGCQWRGPTKELEQHLNKTSGNNEEDSTGETDGCDYRTAQCPECKQNVVLKAMATHQKEAPSHQVVPCELKYAGCDFECPQYQMLAHKEAEMAKHLDLLHIFFKQERDELVLRNVTLWRHMKMVAALLFLVLVICICFILAVVVAVSFHRAKLHNLADTELKLSSQVRLVKDFINEDLEPDLKDAKQDIVQIQETLRDVKTNVNELKNGFSNKYIDNTIRQILCPFIYQLC